jgi:hypothetical protein
MTVPTEEGKRRYPDPDPTKAGYNLDFRDSSDPEAPGLACTCLVSCRPRCAGECGCDAHEVAFQEFADEKGFYTSAGFDEEAALRAYRGLA